MENLQDRVVRKQKLVDIIKNQFRLTIDIEAIFEGGGLEVDEELKFYDFTCFWNQGVSKGQVEFVQSFPKPHLLRIE